ncbi:MAG TPA: hypothetical protein VGK73_03045 [Polyangiaceae bacterium]
MPFSTALDNSILDHFTTKATWAARTANATWIGLSSTTPTKTGTNVTEPSGGAYARVQVTAAEFDAAASSATQNNASQDFPAATADWLSAVNLTHLVIYDASTAGTFLGFKALTVAKPVLNGDTAKVPIGDLDLVMGGT